MSLDHSNQMLRTLNLVPKNAIPTFFGTGAEFDKITNGLIRASGRKANQWYGISTTTEIWKNGKFVPLRAIGINSRQFNTIEKITEAKTASNLRYKTKTGRDYFFNTNGNLTHIHETGHLFAQRYGMPSDWNFLTTKWYNEVGIDVLKSKSEAWAEAWADLYGNKGSRLPNYIKEAMEVHIKKY